MNGKKIIMLPLLLAAAAASATPVTAAGDAGWRLLGRPDE